MSLRVEDPGVEREHIVIGEKKVKVLEGFSQEETLLYVVLGSVYLVDILEAGEAVRHAAVLLDGLRCFPAPVSVLGVAGEPPEVEYFSACRTARASRESENLKDSGPRLVPAHHHLLVTLPLLGSGFFSSGGENAPTTDNKEVNNRPRSSQQQTKKQLTTEGGVTREAGKMIHLVLQPLILEISEVLESTSGGEEQFGLYGLSTGVEHLPDLVYLLPVHGIASQVAEQLKLQVHGAKLSQDGTGTGGPYYGDNKEEEETYRISRQHVGTEKTSNEADVGLKDGHLSVEALQVQMFGHPVPACPELCIHPHHGSAEGWSKPLVFDRYDPDSIPTLGTFFCLKKGCSKGPPILAKVQPHQRVQVTKRRSGTFIQHCHHHDGLPLGVLGDSITDHILQENLKNAVRLFIDETRDTLHTTPMCETTNGGLESRIDKMGGCFEEVARIIALGRAVMMKLDKIMKDKGISFKRLTDVRAGGKRKEKRFEAFEIVPWTDKRTNVSILNAINSIRSLESQIGKQSFTYFRHIMRTNGLEKMLMFGKLKEKRKRGRPTMLNHDFRLGPSLLILLYLLICEDLHNSLENVLLNYLNHAPEVVKVPTLHFLTGDRHFELSYY
ncbi:HIST3H3 [Cordylochernes scorpioides]|uniref:HIST3H3 n=1 Tax=Cordylochernes scorpioides TaxID=51811 RepID=A0ABY6LL92_9ARAC|nr:HIST3H3 [Cordylochernes scorpioides]